MKLKFIGYHGTSIQRAKKMFDNNDMTIFLSDRKVMDRNDYWLGRGVYFFENDDYLAYKWCEDMYKNIYTSSDISVEKTLNMYLIIEGIIECPKDDILDLATNTKHQLVYKKMVKLFEKKSKLSKKYGKMQLHKNDCLVIDYLSHKVPGFVFGIIRGIFISKDQDYEKLQSNFNKKYHIQLCVKDKKYIKQFRTYNQLDVNKIKDIKKDLPSINKINEFVI